MTYQTFEYTNGLDCFSFLLEILDAPLEGETPRVNVLPTRNTKTYDLELFPSYWEARQAITNKMAALCCYRAS